ncbi:MAG: hypothetical protein GY703_02100 [Gammaproteobacteria bacterium]|nr:hypothetical protein [Gammaproteobacteria bacterium]
MIESTLHSGYCRSQPAQLNRARLSGALFLVLALSFNLQVAADHGPEHANPGAAIGVQGELLVSPATITDEGWVNYTYTGEGYPSWHRLLYRYVNLYFTQGYRAGDPFYYFFRPVRWGTVSFSPTHNCIPGRENTSDCQTIGCEARDKTCRLYVRATRTPGVDWGGHFWPNCRAQYYLGPYPATDGGGSQANSIIALEVEGTDRNFDIQLINPLTVTASGAFTQCPDPDIREPEEPKLELSCDDNFGDAPDVYIEESQDQPSTMEFYADLNGVCETYGEDFGFGGDDECDPDVEYCDDPYGQCVDQSGIDWVFGDGDTHEYASAYETLLHTYEDAGDFTVTATAQPFGITTQCQLNLKPPGVRVDVNPVGTKLVITPDGRQLRRATQGSTFEINVAVATTKGYGKVRDLQFLKSSLLDVDAEVLTVLDSPQLPGVPADVDAETVFFDGKFVLEATETGETVLQAPVTYRVLGELRQSNDQETIQIGKGLKVDLFASETISLDQNNRDRNAFNVELIVENIGNVDLVNVRLVDGGLVMQPVPGTQGQLGSVTLLRPLVDGLPGTLAAGTKHTANARLQATGIGAVRIAAVVQAEDEENNFFEIGKGADVLIVDDDDGYPNETSFFRHLNQLAYEYLEQAHKGAAELEARGHAMIENLMQTAADGGDIDAAAQAASASCDNPNSLAKPGQTATVAAGEQDLFDKKLNEKWYIPDFVKTAFSPEERANNLGKELVAAQILASFISSEEATTEFFRDKQELVGGIGGAAGYLSVEHNRKQLANSITRYVKETYQANQEGMEIIYDALINDDRQAAELIEGAFVDLADRQEAAVRNQCHKMAEDFKTNVDLLEQGKYAEYQYRNSKRTKRAGLELISEVAGGMGSQRLLKTGSQQFLKSAPGRFAKQVMDTSNYHYRRAVDGTQRQFGNIKGKVENRVFKSRSGAPGAAGDRRIRADRVAPDSPPVKARNDGILGDPDGEFPGYVGGLSPIEQQGLKGVAGELDKTVKRFAESFPAGHPTRLKLLNADSTLKENVEIQLTPTNPYSSPEWRNRKGLPPVTGKEEIMKGKSINADDIALGVPEKYLGQVAIYNPEKAYQAMSAADKARYRGRYLAMKDTYDKLQTPNSGLRQNVERATTVDPSTGEIVGDTFRINAPTEKQFTRDANGNRVLKEDQVQTTRDIPQKWNIVEETEVDSVGGSIISFEDLNAPLQSGGFAKVGGDMDGHMLGFVSGEDIPAGVKSQLRAVYRAEARKHASDPTGKLFRKAGDLRFADHGSTQFGGDWLAAYDHKRIEYIVERLPEAEGRKLAREWVGFQNDLTRKKNPGKTDQELAEELIDFDDYAARMEFGTRLTSITANNVRVVDGDSSYAIGLIKRNKRRLAEEAGQ